MRAITASGIVPSAMAGSTRCESALLSAPLSDDISASISMKPVTGATSNWIAMRPDTGVRPSSTENRRMSRRPHQKIGIE